jgi:hypothetical protein
MIYCILSWLAIYLFSNLQDLRSEINITILFCDCKGPCDQLRIWLKCILPYPLWRSNSPMLHVISDTILWIHMNRVVSGSSHHIFERNLGSYNFLLTHQNNNRKSQWFSLFVRYQNRETTCLTYCKDLCQYSSNIDIFSWDLKPFFLKISVSKEKNLIYLYVKQRETQRKQKRCHFLKAEKEVAIWRSRNSSKTKEKIHANR